MSFYFYYLLFISYTLSLYRPFDIPGCLAKPPTFGFSRKTYLHATNRVFITIFTKVVDNQIWWHPDAFCIDDGLFLDC